VNVLVVCQGPAYGDERSYNGLRLAGSMAKREDTDVKVFLIGDAVTCAVAGQKLPDGYYHLDRMVTAAHRHGADVGCCGTCLDARGITAEQLVPATHRATLEDLTDWVLWADKTVTF
jgi:uncharacterized protein involved in oxidation of intracellular sulfur